MFLASSVTLFLIGIVVAFWFHSNATRDILPTIISVRDHQDSLRTPDTFAEDFGDNASRGKLTYNGDSSFTFAYSKSRRTGHSFSGVFFPLENVDIDFSKYDEVEVGIKTNQARRIPFNLSVQNKLKTHQYIRQFIGVKKDQEYYTLRLNKFFTPTTWYDSNHVAQVEIPEQDLSKIEALSFESCHLLDKGVEDEFTVHKLVLRKDLFWTYFVIIALVSLGILGLAILFLGLFRKKTEVIHVPIQHVEIAPLEPSDDILLYLAENYTNANLTLSDLATEFGKSNNDLSKIIKEKTEKTFPKYINFLRIEEAKRILNSGEFKTIAEVGYAVGFNSSSNFIRVFKGEEGISPKSFSEQQ
jgi:AraC-like DNA-binding protein